MDYVRYLSAGVHRYLHISNSLVLLIVLKPTRAVSNPNSLVELYILDGHVCIAFALDSCDRRGFHCLERRVAQIMEKFLRGLPFLLYACLDYLWVCSG